MLLLSSLLVLATPALSAAVTFDAHTMSGLSPPGYTPPASRPAWNPFGLVNHIIYPRAAPNTAAPDPVLQLQYIAPTSNTCAGAANANECAVASPAVVQAIVNGFVKYGVTTAPEQAALLSWMIYESAEFKYNQNHFPAPGKPGQGTRCMMSPTFVKEYALSIPELKAKVPTGSAPTDQSATLALVQPDQYSFAAASWYYNAHCSDAQKKQVQAGGQNNWATALISGCINTAIDDKRVAYWKRACEALGVPIAP